MIFLIWFSVHSQHPSLVSNFLDKSCSPLLSLTKSNCLSGFAKINRALLRKGFHPHLFLFFLLFLQMDLGFTLERGKWIKNIIKWRNIQGHFKRRGEWCITNKVNVQNGLIENLELASSYIWLSDCIFRGRLHLLLFLLLSVKLALTW